MYNVDSLKAGIDAAKKNIKTFEDAIQRERDTISEYREMIKAIERKKREAEEAEKNVHIEVVKE